MKRQGSKCKCGSTTHSCTSHRDCPLKRRKVYITPSEYLDGQLKAQLSHVLAAFAEPTCKNLHNNTGKVLVLELFNYLFSFHEDIKV